MMQAKKREAAESFFITDRSFYHSLAALIVTLSIQNLLSYSVNMIDNIMLGSYSQAALSGAATVNQIFFIVQQMAIAMDNALVAIASQYWGKRQCEPIRKVSRIALLYCAVCAIAILLLCSLFPGRLLGLFTTSQDILAEGQAYLSIVRFSFVLFFFSNMLMAVLRSVEDTKISVVISAVSLLINTAINYTLIFGRFGFPELGIRGAAIGTCIARVAELLIILYYLWKKDTKVRLFLKSAPDDTKVDSGELSKMYLKVCIPMTVTKLLWAIATPVQTAILGHLSDDAIAANSVATTFYQYLKVIVSAVASAASVMIGKKIGEDRPEQVRAAGRTMSVIVLCIGMVLGSILFLLRDPLLSLYALSEDALLLADHLIVIMSVVMVGMSYQMPVSAILQGSGDIRFCASMNLISVWLIVMPLSFIAAFVLDLPVEIVVICLQSDQVFKCVPVFLRFRRYRWIHKLTVEEKNEPQAEVKR